MSRRPTTTTLLGFRLINDSVLKLGVPGLKVTPDLAGLDGDKDGVLNTADECPDTGVGLPVDSVGCSCYDSDEGLMFYKKGSVKVFKDGGGESELTDYCSQDTLYEYYCDHGFWNKTFYSCPQGCEGGRCLCEDEDGKTPFIEGGGYWVPDDPDSPSMLLLKDEVCTDWTHVMEYWCDEDQQFGVSSLEMVCPMGCKNGVCLCEDSDYGFNVYSKGTAQTDVSGIDFCLDDGVTLHEFVCDSQAANGVRGEEIKCPGGVCKGGECEVLELDPEEDKYIQGQIRGDPWGEVIVMDECVDDHTVRQYWVDYMDGEIKNSTDTCTGFCKDGYCRSCPDGVKNGYEEGVDCGCYGCPPCGSMSTCETGTQYAPADTMCEKNYPDDTYTIPDNKVGETKEACNTYEVCHEGLDYIVEQAAACCNGFISDAHCEEAVEEGNGDFKRCMGVYIVRGFGTYSKWMHDYFWGQLCCDNDPDCVSDGGCSNADMGGCQCTGIAYNDNVNVLPCTSSKSWSSDTDMSKNSCAYSSFYPAHAVVNVLETGVCHDYMMAVLTVLRKAGYDKDEVYGFCDGGHCYNLVKFSGDNKYHVVDTTGNDAGVRFGQLPTGWWNYCDRFDPEKWCFDGKNLANGAACTNEPYERKFKLSCAPSLCCKNDRQNVGCPPLDDIVGC
ncbi:MAG: hypothetical protein GF414_01425 [Candidatus Altiarchaeales archaeon]|nr:hypothetical protein [Candidatus Altiarchaeales archaeon]